MSPTPPDNEGAERASRRASARGHRGEVSAESDRRFRELAREEAAARLLIGPVHRGVAHDNRRRPPQRARTASERMSGEAVVVEDGPGVVGVVFVLLVLATVLAVVWRARTLPAPTEGGPSGFVVAADTCA